MQGIGRRPSNREDCTVDGVKQPNIEWPTLGLIVVTYLAFGLLTWFANDLPWWLLVPLGGYLVCLFGSLQHEALHGHPTRSAVINEALVFLPVPLWFPYRRYKKLHLQHHRDNHLTDPQEDPEAYYLEPDVWAGAPAWARAVLTLNNTLAGRMTLGPVISALRFFASEFRLALAGDRTVITAWALHGAGLVPLWLWVEGVCGMAFWQYGLLIVYPGISLTFLRTFAEHRAHEQAGCRTIIVESNRILGLVFLNNNLHAAHHEHPSLAWYRLPDYYAEHRQRLARSNCGYVVNGYRQFFKSYFFTAKEPVAHPLRERTLSS